jgi:methyl-accepting chemotaxis protein
MAQNTRRGTPRETVDHTEVMMELASHVTDLSQRFKELEAIQSEIPAGIQEQLANYQQQLNALDEQMSALKRSTAGTRDYEIAMENAVAAMNAMAGIATELPVAIQKQHEGLQGQYEALKKSVAGIVQPLVSLSTILRTVLELVEGPLSLSNDAVERLSVSVEKRLRALPDRECVAGVKPPR